MFQGNNFVRNADLKRVFSKGHTTHWCCKLYKASEAIIDTIPTFHLDILPQRYNEAFLRKTELAMENVMKKLDLN